jgi:transglutaminase-like putative cysteine protease
VREQLGGGGKELAVRIQGGMNKEKTIPWNDEVVGLYRQDQLFREFQVKPGDNFSYLSFEPTINSLARTQVHVKDYEQVEVFAEGKSAKTKVKLLRVEAVPDKIEIGKTALQLPTLVAWLDKDYHTVRSEVELFGLGKLVLLRSPKEVAMRAGSAPAIGQMSLVKLDRAIPNAYGTTSAVYKIQLKNGSDPAKAFASDARQKMENIQGNTFELHIDSASGVETATDTAKPGPEFLQSSYFVNSSDPTVRKYARQAAGKEKDPWRKALAVSHWVNRHMDKKNYTEAFATSDEAARTLEGDCTEHSVLAAAMCRAVGVPSRTALGLVYANDRQKGPLMAFHMWIEVWVNGKWIALDPTLGLDTVGGAHLKISDHSWDNITDLTPLLPVINVVGRLSIQVISAS